MPDAADDLVSSISPVIILLMRLCGAVKVCEPPHCLYVANKS
jgi:hypothetical protein